MAFSVTLTSGKVFTTNERLSTAKLNMLGRPTITIVGALGDLTDVNAAAKADGTPLVYDAGTSKWVAAHLINRDCLQAMTGAQAAVDGASGAVPKPVAGEDDEFLRGDGTWVAITQATAPYVGSATVVPDTDGVIAEEHHALGAIPNWVQWMLVCNAAAGDGGWVQNDEIPIEAVTNDTTAGAPIFTAYKNTLHVGLISNAHTSAMAILHKTTGLKYSITDRSKWSVKCYAGMW